MGEAGDGIRARQKPSWVKTKGGCLYHICGIWLQSPLHTWPQRYRWRGADKDYKGCAGYVEVSVWSGHSRWLFSCSLYIPCPTSSCFTCTLCTQLTILLLALGPSWWLFLSKGLWGTCVSAVSLVTNEPTWPQFQPWESRLPPYSACCLLHMVGCCSKTLLQTCTLPGLLNHWCLCCWLGLFLQSLKLGKQ